MKQLILLAAIVLTSVTAWCDDNSNVYFRTEVGRAFQENVHARYFSGKVNFDVDVPVEEGARVDFATGYQFNKYLAAEISGGWIDTKLKDLAQHDCRQIPLFGSLIVSYPIKFLKPFAGIGTGVEYAEFVPNSAISKAETDSDWVWAYQFKGGLAAEIGRHCEVAFVYSYIETQSFNGHASPGTLELGPLFTHSFSGSVTFKF